MKRILEWFALRMKCSRPLTDSPAKRHWMPAKKIASVLLFLCAVAGFSAHAVPLRFRLLESTAVSGNVVLLSHFLPKGVTENFRRAAERVSLGSAPAPGAVRQFSREH